MKISSFQLLTAGLLTCVTATALAQPPTVTVTAGSSTVSIGPAGVVARSGAPRQQESPYSGLTNGRIFVPGVNGTPGQWLIRGDGNGPVIVGGEIFVPGPYGGLVPVQPRSRRDRPSGNEPPTEDGRGVRTSSQILRETEREIEERKAAEAPPAPPAPAPLKPIDLHRSAPEVILEAADSRDPSRRASAYQALPSVSSSLHRPLALKKLLLALDEEDLRLVQIASRALAGMQSAAAVPKLLFLLNVEDVETLAATAEALGRIGDGRALGPLKELSEHADPKVAQAVVDAVAALERSAALSGKTP